MTIAHLEALANLFSQVYPLKLKGSANLIKFQNINLIKPKMQELKDARMELAEKYGQKDERGKLITENDNVKVQEGLEQEVGQQMIEIMNTKVDITFNKIKFSSILEACNEQPELTPQWNDMEMLILEPIIDFNS